jgi:hypothetical protein
MRRFAAAFEDDGGFDAADAALSNVDASEAARRQGDPINALDIPSTGGWAGGRVGGWVGLLWLQVLSRLLSAATPWQCD